LAVVFFIALLSGCTTTPNLDFVWNDRMSDEEMVRNASIIVIGKVVRQTGVGPVRDTYRLMRVDCSVENTLKGEAPGKAVMFYFYSPWRGAAGDWNSLQDNHRYIFFLTGDRGVLRAVWDVWRSNIRVYSGKHRTIPLTGNEPLLKRITMLLFTPGEALDPDEFSVGLLHAYTYGWQYLGRWRTAQVLNGLLKNEHRAVRIGACEELTLHYEGIDDCWNTVDFGDGSLLRFRYGVIPPQMIRIRHRNRMLETRDAEAWWAMAVRQYPGKQLLDELRLLTVVDDSGIRTRFCALLEKK
jgi:hypothetical protein